MDPRRKSRVNGRPRTKWLNVDDPKERAYLQHRQTVENPRHVMRAWRFESMTRSKAAILNEAAHHAYADWCAMVEEWLLCAPRTSGEAASLPDLVRVNKTRRVTLTLRRSSDPATPCPPDLIR